MEENKGEWKIIAKAQDSTAKQKEQNAGKTPNPDNDTAAQGHATNSKEPILRAATTDSSRVPKNPNDETPIGGNIR